MRGIFEAGFGHVLVRTDGPMVTGVDLRPKPATTNLPDGFPDHVTVAMEAYLEGRAPRPVVPTRTEGTEFQHAVWRSLADIPPGETITYGEMAERVGKPGAARAVGQALRRNPLPLVQPCHRVVASDGLGGFGGCDAGSEDAQLDVKRWLIEHEQRS